MSYLGAAYDAELDQLSDQTQFTVLNKIMTGGQLESSDLHLMWAYNPESVRMLTRAEGAQAVEMFQLSNQMQMVYNVRQFNKQI